MLPVVGWRVYCADGSTYTSNPETIPPTVQVVVRFHEYPYRTLDSGVDQYELDGVTLIGSLLPDDEHYAIMDAAFKDMTWPPTS